jgi:hypothetical protein
MQLRVHPLRSAGRVPGHPPSEAPAPASFEDAIVPPLPPLPALAPPDPPRAPPCPPASVPPEFPDPHAPIAPAASATIMSEANLISEPLPEDDPSLASTNASIKRARR